VGEWRVGEWRVGEWRVGERSVRVQSYILSNFLKLISLVENPIRSQFQSASTTAHSSLSAGNDREENLPCLIGLKNKKEAKKNEKR
jgi:hypothetical protein